MNKLSIVIIGRNEEQAIGRCLDAAIAAADEIGGAEIIYVDSHSTDKTVDVVRSRGVRAASLDQRLRRCPSAGRYYGSLLVSGEFILFLDADTLVYKGFLTRAIETLTNEPRMAGVNGQIDDFNEKGIPVPGIEEKYDERVDVEWLRGPSCLYRRSALVEVGSFDPELAMEEEAELGLRLVRNGWTLAVLPVPMARHTRCFHTESIGAVFSTFMRDYRAKRLGEVTVTIAHSFRAGTGWRFCWLRLKTTILFLVWVFGLGGTALLPGDVARYAVIGLFVAGLIAVYLRKLSLTETIAFIPSKTLNVVDVLSGVMKMGRVMGAPRSLSLTDEARVGG